jgi:hypothetical protein
MVATIELNDPTLWVPLLVLLIVVLFLIAVLIGVASAARRSMNPYSPSNLDHQKSFLIEGEFFAATLAGFKIAYRLEVGCERIDTDEYCKARMADDSVRQSLLERFHLEVVQRFLDEHNVFFHLDWRKAATVASNLSPVSIYEVKREATGQRIQEIHLPAFKDRLRQMPPFVGNGCELTLADFSLPYPSSRMTKAKSGIISEEQRQLIFAHPEFSEESEKLAIALHEKSLEPETTGALKGIGRYVEFSKTIAEAEQLVIKEIQHGPGSESEKQDKIERFRDELRMIRERYEK